MNNIVRIMLRKGILTDLARVSHYLDLSSPNMPASVNAALKPLETLSRIVNQPTTATNNKAGKQKAQGSMSEEPAGYQTGPVFNIFAYFQ
jgi:E3 ubiquitin-protein ligase HUWE1